MILLNYFFISLLFYLIYLLDYNYFFIRMGEEILGKKFLGTLKDMLEMRLIFSFCFGFLYCCLFIFLLLFFG